MSSMVIAFTKQADLEQACYEATVDLTVFIEHLRDIAKRCEEKFPEVAAGLRGSADGIGQYLRGIDGKWKTRAKESMKAALTDPELREHLWAYEFCREPHMALLLMGGMMAVASAKPHLPFWVVLREAHTKLGDLTPLINRMLVDSPLRRKKA